MIRRKIILGSKLFICQILVFLFPSFVVAGPSATGGIVLKQEIGARPLSMGGSYTAIGDDTYSIFWNPAGLSRISNTEITATYLRSVFDTNYGFLGYTSAFGKNRVGGISILSLQAGLLEDIDENGISRTISAESDYVFTLSYSQQVISTIAAGINIKWLYSILAEMAKAHAFAVDFGLLYCDVIINHLNFGISIRNIGTDLKYVDIGDQLPQQLLIGISYSVKFGIYQLFITSDTSQILNESQAVNQFNIGAELKIGDIFALRLGYRFNKKPEGLTLGIGDKISSILIDYAYVLTNTFVGESKHMISIGTRW